MEQNRAKIYGYHFLLVSLKLVGLCIKAKVMLSHWDRQCSAEWGEQKITKWREA
jgi:hypothetical protein